MRLLIALMVVVGMVEAQAQTYSVTVYIPPPATYVFMADTMSMKRLGYALDYSRGLVLTNDGRALVAVKKLEPKSRAEKKAELQEASKRSADFEQILREAEGKPNQTLGSRRYTVREIDELREACEKRWLFGTTYSEESSWSRSYYGDEKTKAVEELVRTYMLAGITAKQIYEEDKRDYLKRRKK